MKKRLFYFMLGSILLSLSTKSVCAQQARAQTNSAVNKGVQQSPNLLANDPQSLGANDRNQRGNIVVRSQKMKTVSADKPVVYSQEEINQNDNNLLQMEHGFRVITSAEFQSCVAKKANDPSPKSDSEKSVLYITDQTAGELLAKLKSGTITITEIESSLIKL